MYIFDHLNIVFRLWLMTYFSFLEIKTVTIPEERRDASQILKFLFMVPNQLRLNQLRTKIKLLTRWTFPLKT